MSVELLAVLTAVAAPTAGAFLLGRGPSVGGRRAVATALAVVSLGASLVAATTFAHASAIEGPWVGGDIYSQTGAPVLWLALAALLGVMPRARSEGAARWILLTGVGASCMLFAQHAAVLLFGWALSALSITASVGGAKRRVAGAFLLVSTVCVAAGLGLLWQRIGTGGLDALSRATASNPGAMALILVGVALRLGVPPFQGWMLHVLEGGPRGPVLAGVLPMSSLVLLERLTVLGQAGADISPLAAEWLAVAALLGGAMVLVQRNLSRAVGWLLASIHAVVMFGALDPDPVGHVGGLSSWLAVVLSSTGFMLVVLALTARRGDIEIRHMSGLYGGAPLLCGLFLLFGLAMVGLPGTADFVAEDLTLHGSVAHHPWMLASLVGALSTAGFAVLWLTAKLFFGQPAPIPLPDILRRERIVLGLLAGALLVTGLFPQVVVDVVPHSPSPRAASVVAP